MTRPARALVHLDALRANYELIAQRAAPAACYAVIKADGYGHGIVEVARALHAAPKFAVACLEEALRLREAGIQKPILMLEGLFSAEELSICVAQQIELAVHEAWQIDLLVSAKLPATVGIWLKLNTGMNRLGLAPASTAVVLERLQANTHLRILGLMTHFASADEVDLSSSQEQWQKFSSVRNGLPLPLACSAANSAAIFALRETHAQWVRPGISLYGSSPFAQTSAASLGLRPVMSLRSALIAVRDIPAGASVGYGATWTAQHGTRMGVIAIGYADGYPRHAPSGTPVYVDGVRVPLIGRVSMDMITVDLSQCPNAKVGDSAELWGEHLSVDEVAACAGTIGYELLTGVTARVPRQYLG